MTYAAAGHAVKGEVSAPRFRMYIVAPEPPSGTILASSWLEIACA